MRPIATVAGATALLALALALALAAASSEARPVRNGVIGYSTDGSNSVYDERCGGYDECDLDELEAKPVTLHTVRPSGRGGRQLRCSTRSRPCADDSPSFSPDGRLLASSSEFGVTIRRVAGPIVKHVPLEATSLSWSPDGRLLAAVVPERGATGDEDAGALHLIPRGTSAERRVLSLRGLQSAAWAPTGRALALTTRVATPRSAFVDQGEVSVVRRDGSGLRRIASGLGYTDALWPRRGTILWEREFRYPRFGDIMRSDPTGRRVTRLVRGGEDPVVSRGRGAVAYLCFRGLCRVALSRERRRLVSGRCDAMQSGYAWSPDGRWLACGTVSGDLIRVNARSRRARRVTRGVYPGVIDWQRRPVR